jgi:hypothetical protein
MCVTKKLHVLYPGDKHSILLVRAEDEDYLISIDVAQSVMLYNQFEKIRAESRYVPIESLSLHILIEAQFDIKRII